MALVNIDLCSVLTPMPIPTAVAVLLVSLNLLEVEALEYFNTVYPLFLGRQIGITLFILNLFFGRTVAPVPSSMTG